MDSELIYLDTYLLQQDMRVRMPKSILENLGAVKGKTKFDVYLNKDDNSLTLKINTSDNEKSNKGDKDGH